MANLEVCRVCLQVDVRMYKITDSKLQNIYEKLTGQLITDNDMKPKCICYICHALLRNCLNLFIQVQNANSVLNMLLQDNGELTKDSIKRFNTASNTSAYNYSVKLIDNPTYVLTENSYVKIENDIEYKTEDETKDELDIKTEYNNDVIETNDASSDSEYDVPLKDIKTRQKAEKQDVKVRKKIKKNREVIKVDAEEIILSHAEQMADMMKRAQSSNYIHSPYKCELCYKGFIDSRTYSNHVEKHSESCGPHACPVCALRYRSARLLRVHVANSHARRFQCNKCSVYTHNACQARDHEKWHNGFTYECKICSQQFRKPTSYLSHIRACHGGALPCARCGLGFRTPPGLRLHLAKAHRQVAAEKESEPASDRFCDECSVQFLSIDAWKRHRLLSHTKDRNDSSHCPICKQQVDEALLSAHLRKHARELRGNKDGSRVMAPASCDQCGGKFVNKYKLQDHIKRMHLGIKYNKNIICEVCGKKCTSRASLVSHARTHTDARPYPCAACAARFRDAHQLRLHARTHSGERPYACQLCPRAFAQRPALTRHHRVHTGVKPYICQVCSRAFSQSNSLKLHVNTVHLKMPPPKRRRNKMKNAMDSDHEQRESKTLSSVN